MIHNSFRDTVRFSEPAGSVCELFEQAAELASADSWSTHLVSRPVQSERWKRYVQIQMAIFKSWSQRLRDLQLKGKSSFSREAPRALLAEILVVSTFTRLWHTSLLWESEADQCLNACMPELEYLQSRMIQFEQHYLLYLGQETRSGQEHQLLREAYRLSNSWTIQVMGALSQKFSEESKQSPLGELLFEQGLLRTVSIPVALPPDEELLELLQHLNTNHKSGTTLLSALSRSVSDLVVNQNL